MEAVLRPVYCTRCAVHRVHRGSVGLLKLVVLRFVKVGPAAGAADSPALGRSHSRLREVLLRSPVPDR